MDEELYDDQPLDDDELAPEPELSDEDEVEPAPDDDGLIEIDGERYRPEDLKPYISFGNWVRSNPDKAEELVAWERGERIMVPRAQPPESASAPTADDDSYLYDEDDRLAQLESRLAAYEQSIANRSEHDAREAVDNGIASFRDAHPELTSEDLTTTLLHVRDRRWLETIDPNLSPSQRAAEVAARVEEAYRVRFFDQARTSASVQAGRSVAQQVRRARRAASAGSAASVARVEPEPANDQERMNAIVREIRDFQQQA